MTYLKFVVPARCFRSWAVALLVGFSLFQNHPALGFVYEFREVYDGTSPSGPPPWILAQFQDLSPNTVQLTITASSLAGLENVRGLYFNLKPDYNPKHLNFQVSGTGGAFALPSISTGKNLYKAGGDGLYDILFTFATDQSPSLRFDRGDSLIYNISGISGLTASDFAHLSKSAGGFGPFYAAAHIQRIGSNLDSGWIYPEDGPIIPPVPEPSSMVLMLLGSAALLLKRFSTSRV